MMKANDPKRASTRLLTSPIFWIGSVATSLALAVGCSSSTASPGSTSESCAAGDSVACTCANGQAGTEACGSNACECAGMDASAATPEDDAGTSSAAADSGHNGNGGHIDDGAAPASLYGACAIQGSFGWPCTQPNALDPTNCTDPNFPFCFGGGQGYWCTAACADAGFEAACHSEDAGCAPSSTACNAKGYCK